MDSIMPPLKTQTTPCQQGPSLDRPWSSAFRVPCPGCGIIFSLPYDSIVGALLDQCLSLEERLHDHVGAREELRP